MENYFIFDTDISLNGGYWYTTSAQTSSQLANDRLTKATISIANLSGKKIIDVGCGDGTYTWELFRRCRPKLTSGFDISKNAIALAKKRYGKYDNLTFVHGDIDTLGKRLRNFDYAIVRGVLHHVDNPAKAVQMIAHMANEIIILEPNGYNPILKIIERLSPYHRGHQEKSYAPFEVRHWLKEAKFTLISDTYVGLVPFFCPDWTARSLKVLEPITENLTLISNIVCGVYVVHAKIK